MKKVYKLINLITVIGVIIIIPFMFLLTEKEIFLKKMLLLTMGLLFIINSLLYLYKNKIGSIVIILIGLSIILIVITY
ncbi:MULTISPECIES: hypothetical protein [Bacillus cereus group]|jgi:hypothetical protein|uniref:hypothetical protein n=1 Tax=Bacillus cereus group TaxID=86661 RepID=UPI0011A6AA38|nr:MULTISPECIES: hypothetical protein [Bacillus cereus group]MEA1012929.1 hypothetical protein [Bacillus cereus]